MIACQKRLILEPPEGVSWASKMVLNPAMIQHPTRTNEVHMLFRATGPCEELRLSDKPLPYPISLGYGVSYDYGETWDFDFDRPALAPAVKYDKKDIYLPDGRVNYANGCIEDPRLFYFENKLYLSVASRVFPPGPYWEKDDPEQCMPDWVFSDTEIEPAIRDNFTVSVLYKVNLGALSARDYDSAFEYIGPISDPAMGDNRDVFLFPERIMIEGEKRVACLHRPMNPKLYDVGKKLNKPSIFITSANSISDLVAGRVKHHVLAEPEYDWESNRIGASWTPLKLAQGIWMLPYHGKQDSIVGYTQSFMVLEEKRRSIPQIIVRKPARILYANEPWELGTDFPTPCMFTCSGLLINGHRLLMGYGAADQKVGLVEVEMSDLFNALMSTVSDMDYVEDEPVKIGVA